MAHPDHGRRARPHRRRDTTPIGIAVGTCGTASLPWLLRLPVECAGLAVVLALHRSADSERATAGPWVTSPAVGLALVTVGAFVETYLTPQR